MPEPVTTLVSYYPKEGKEDQLLALIERHWPTLDRLGLVTSKPPQVWRAIDKRSQRRFFLEMFQWRDDTASEVAHQTPEVMAVWEPMGPLLETMHLTRIEPITLSVARA